MALVWNELPIQGTSSTFKLLCVAVLGLACLIPRTAFTMRLKSQVPFLASAVTSFSSSNLSKGSIDSTWHAPASTEVNSINSLTGRTGVYGFIYDGAVNPPDFQYGTYNWCNMPHVRATEYPLVENDDYSLQYVEVIHRHHKRTVYAANAFPVESYGWDCDDSALFYYGQPKDGPSAAHSYWEGYTSPVNPFKPAGFVGSCQFPQLTAGGLEDSWQHGRDLYEVYHDRLHFLPDRPNEKMKFRVTNNVLTSHVAGMVINGMFGIQADIPLLVEASLVDSLEPHYPCPVGSALFSAITSGTNWTRHLQLAEPLFTELDDISGVSPTDASFHVSLDHYYDNLSARQCHGKPLPCKLVNGANSSTCIQQAMVDEVYRIGNYEYSYMYRDDPRSLAVSASRFGLWVGELTKHFREVISGKCDVIYRHNVAHDGSLSLLLSMLQIHQMVWPGMGSEVVFEVYKSSSDHIGSQRQMSSGDPASSFYLRVLWKGQILRSSHPNFGLMDMVPLVTVLEYFDGLVGVDANLVQGKCNGSIPF